MKRLLKIGRRHGSGKFRLGSHVITMTPTVYDLNKEEEKELLTEGPAHWIVEVKEEVKKKEVKKAPKKEDK